MIDAADELRRLLFLFLLFSGASIVGIDLDSPKNSLPLNFDILPVPLD